LLQTDLEVERLVFPNRTDDSILSITGHLIKFNRTIIVINLDFEALIDIGNNVQVNWMFLTRNFIQNIMFFVSRSDLMYFKCKVFAK
jgi:hypothetical protein